MNELSVDAPWREALDIAVAVPPAPAATGPRDWWRLHSVLIDLDGTLVHQHAPAKGAAARLERLTGRYVVVSNNSTHTAAGLARTLGCRLVDEAPEFVVLARNERFNYAKLSAIVNDLRRGARLVVTNPDLCHAAP